MLQKAIGKIHCVCGGGVEVECGVGGKVALNQVAKDF